MMQPQDTGEPFNPAIRRMTRAQARRVGAIPLEEKVDAAGLTLSVASYIVDDLRMISKIKEMSGAVRVHQHQVSRDQFEDLIASTYPVKIPEKSSPVAFHRISRTEALKCDAIALSVSDGLLLIGLVNPSDQRVLRELQGAAGIEIDPVRMSLSEIKGRIRTTYAASAPVSEAAIAGGTLAILDAMFSEAVRRHSSDIHLLSWPEYGEVRFSIDGSMVSWDRQLSHAQITSMVESLLNEADIVNSSNKNVSHTGRIDRVIEGKRNNLRIGTAPVVGGTSMVIRLASSSETIRTLEEAGMRGKILDRYLRLVSYPNGLIITTGPVASGKSSLMQSTLKTIHKPTKSYRSAEDPVETILPFVQQTDISKGGENSMSFEDAIKAFVRMNIDVMMIGEIRDKETVQVSVLAALLGHQIFSTTHSGSAPIAVRRLMNDGAKPDDLADALVCIVGQRLPRQLCLNCKEKAPLPAALKRIALSDTRLGAELVDLENYHVAHGCTYCEDGYKGRVAIFELLDVTLPEVGEMIVSGGSAQQIADADPSYEPMILDGIRRVFEGMCSIEEIRAKVRWPYDDDGDLVPGGRV